MRIYSKDDFIKMVNALMACDECRDALWDSTMKLYGRHSIRADFAKFIFDSSSHPGEDVSIGPDQKKRDRKFTRHGYVEIKVGKDHPIARKSGWAYEHRVVVYERAGEIPEGMVVHHINGIKHDNRTENLMVMTKFHHRRRHESVMIEVGMLKKENRALRALLEKAGIATP